MLNEEDGSGTLETTYVHSPGRQIGTVLATSSGSTASTGDWAYYFQDAIGSTRGLWDNSGVRTGKYDYTPFGGKYSEHGEDITRKFTGHDWDSDVRLYYTAYRYYSPDSNRWLTRDPLGMVDGPNVYAYVVNNPVSLSDAQGLISDSNWLKPNGWVRIGESCKGIGGIYLHHDLGGGTMKSSSITSYGEWLSTDYIFLPDCSVIKVPGSWRCRVTCSGGSVKLDCSKDRFAAWLLSLFGYDPPHSGHDRPGVNELHPDFIGQDLKPVTLRESGNYQVVTYSYST